jgi:hypothetical protein
MNKIVFSGLLVLLLVLIFGCTQTSVCGDGICSQGEENSCPTDCVAPINGNVTVSVFVPFDVQGDAYLEYYNSANVSLNLSESLSSVLGSHWQGTQSKNLSISLNDSKSIQKPLVKGGNTVVIQNPIQGEYYFTARTEDYGYFGTSEKILINEDKDYDVKLDLKPSQPMVRLRAVDVKGNQLVGPGSITVYEVVKYLDKQGSGDWKTEEHAVSSIQFDNDSNMNGLFSLWSPKEGIDFRSHFKAVLEKTDYGKTTLDWIDVGQKYLDNKVVIVKEEKTGDLKVQLVPGSGTTLKDLNRLIGKTIEVYSSSLGPGKSEPISSSLTVMLKGYKYGSYSLSYAQSFDPNVPPLQVEGKQVILSAPSGTDSVKVFLGSVLDLGVVDTTNSFIDANQIKLYKVCVLSPTSASSCTDYGGALWSMLAGPNPYKTGMAPSSEEDLNALLNTKVTFELGYGGTKKTFTAPYFKQGFNVVRMQFDISILEQDARTAWKVAVPLGIADWARDSNKLTVILKNNDVNITFKDMNVLGLKTVEGSIGNLGPGATITRTIKITGCVRGKSFSIPKANIVIIYRTAGNSVDKTELAVADILGTCS